MEGFVSQADHDTAMLELRAELSEAINAKQTEIDAMKVEVQQAVQIAQAAVSEQLEALTAERDRYKDAATATSADNTRLRNALSGYLLETDGGKAALAEFKTMLLSSQAAAIQAELAKIK